MTKPENRPPVGSSINGWRIVEDDLEGRAGWVFMVCRDGAPDDLYALKMWRGEAKTAASKPPARNKSEDANPIVAEANRILTANLPDTLPSVVEIGDWHGRPYFVMELLDDIDWPVSDKVYRRIAVEAFEALAQLHGRRILHCDITTRHLVLKNGKVALLDLDNACSFDDVPMSHDAIGTDPYIAPEVASRGELTPQADIYSLAYVLREHCPENLLDTLNPVFRTALDPDPSGRPHSAAACAVLLENARPPHHRFKTVVTAISNGILRGWLWYVIVMALVFVFRWAHVWHRRQADIVEGSELKAARECFRRGDYSNEVRHLHRAASAECQHVRQCCHILSMRYRDGMGVRKDLDKSREFLLLSKSQPEGR